MTKPPKMLQSRAIRSRECENIMVFAELKVMKGDAEGMALYVVGT